MRIEDAPKLFSRRPFVRKRRLEEPPSLVVVHHNAGGGNAAATYRALRSRYLSCHYVVEASGRIVRLADEDVVTLHAGKANGRSIGIECQGRGRLAGRKRRAGERYYADHVHGKTYGDWIPFTFEQRAALSWLVLDICQRHGIPAEIPTDAEGKAIRHVLDDWQEWDGVLAHYMITRRKIDAPPREMDWLVEALSGAPLPV